MSNTSPNLDHRKGLLLTFIGSMIITFDTPVLRLIDGPQWTVMFWRATFLSLAVFAWWIIAKALKKSPGPLINGKAGFVIILLYAGGNLTFITAVFHTTIAHVVFILALTPLFAALFSFFWFREKLPAITWAAMVIALIGVTVIVWSGLKNGSTFGDLMAAATATTMSLAFTVTRRTGKDMSMSPVLLGAITAIAAFGISGAIGTDGIDMSFFALKPEQWGWMLLNGLIIMPLSYSLLALGPRYISAAEVALFLLMETALAPIWVWLAVGEKVTTATIFGGSIILITLLAHSLVKLRTRQPSKSRVRTH